MMETNGLLMIFTGNGKGKTTAALGMAMRSAGHGLKVCIIQFIKGSRTYGEIETIKRHSDYMDLHIMGRGFTWKSDNLEEDKRLALEGWNLARQCMDSGSYHLVILDEFTYLLHYKMLDLDACLEVLASRGKKQHVLITGRYAPGALVEAADLVTEMQAIKHPLQAGIKAQRGIEF